MNERIAQIIILAEDERHVNLIRRYLERAVSCRQIRVIPLADGRGAGEQHVRKNYPGEVARHRGNVVRRKAVLVVVTDADMTTVAQRAAQLAATLREDGQESRRDDEAIALLIPKRNVETWILCLTGRSVDEMTDYKHDRGIDESIRPAAEQLFDWTRPNFSLPPHCIDSLRQAIPELKRVER